MQRDRGGEARRAGAIGHGDPHVPAPQGSAAPSPARGAAPVRCTGPARVHAEAGAHWELSGESQRWVGGFLQG